MIAETLARDPETSRKEVGATPEEWSVAWPYIEPQLQFADGGTGRRSCPWKNTPRRSVRIYLLRQKAGRAGADTRRKNPHEQLTTKVV